ncbi:MAG: hypothetical protein O9247_01705 [Rhodobacteraceae bacterium]|nr:hypothetical protein [Paracoccaceae bacterium]
MTATLIPAAPRPRWITLAALGGIGWNLFGLVQLATSVTATPESLIASGLTPEQAAVMTGYPVWMTAAFFLGVAGGLVGSILLALHSALARPVLLASLLAYVALWIGDAVHGVFAAMGAPQVAILSTVVAIAAGLFFAATRNSARA